ncbi:MAG: DUF2490 domain-containing protein [Aureispira sp.]
MPLSFKMIGLLLSLSFYFIPTSTAQITLRQTNDEHDTRLWVGLQYKHSFSKAWSMQIDLQTRLKEHLSVLDRGLLDLSFSYQHPKNKVLKLFKFETGARFFTINDIQGNKQGPKFGYRLYGSITLKKSWKRLAFAYRFQYQNQTVIPRYFDGEAELWEQEQTLRNRISLGYNFKKWKLDPEITAGIFFPLEQADNQGFSRLRLGLGTKYKINKHHLLKFRLIYQQSLGITTTERDFILAIIYQYNTKAKKKKKKKKK